MKKPDYFTKCGPGKRPLFAAFDFETDGLGGKLLAASTSIEIVRVVLPTNGLRLRALLAFAVGLPRAGRDFLTASGLA